MSTLDFFEKGGLFMYPLLILSVLTVTVTIERLFFFRSLKKSCDKLTRGLAGSGNIPEKYLKALQHLKKTRDSNTEIDLFLEEEYHENSRYFGLLSFSAATAPLFGLLGTIAGIMVLFRNIELTGFKTDPAMLSGGIWQAIITTLAGLMVAIPATAALQYLDHTNQGFLLLVKKALCRAIAVNHD
ncbi:MAG: MotA/TolQ/ExbB proton channel family protein [Candidatus Wallbacteria bacterium]|nr:MotA/TolQ/ExbB proton channel family protein [Candidatus Wallbacteria bacterium]